jgi:hypothetical protein
LPWLVETPISCGGGAGRFNGEQAP